MEMFASLLEVETPPCAVSGKWFLLQWTPDLALNERVNIGLYFVNSSTGEVSLRTLDYFGRLECLYGHAAEFHAKLACELAKEVIPNSVVVPSTIGMHLTVSEQGFAQGESADSVVEQLYSSAIPLGRPHDHKKRASRFRSLKRSAVVSRLNRQIRTSMGDSAPELIASEPYLRYGEDENEKLYLPYRMEDKVATVASAVFNKPEKVTSGIYQAHFDLQAALSHHAYAKRGLFILRSEEISKESVQDKIDNELDKLLYHAAKQNINAEVRENLEDLGNDIIQWSELEPA